VVSDHRVCKAGAVKKIPGKGGAWTGGRTKRRNKKKQGERATVKKTICGRRLEAKSLARGKRKSQHKGTPEKQSRTLAPEAA